MTTSLHTVDFMTEWGNLHICPTSFTWPSPVLKTAFPWCRVSIYYKILCPREPNNGSSITREHSHRTLFTNFLPTFHHPSAWLHKIPIRASSSRMSSMSKIKVSELNILIYISKCILLCEQCWLITSGSCHRWWVWDRFNGHSVTSGQRC